MEKEQTNFVQIQNEQVSGLFFEYMMARWERTVKRIIIAFTTIIVVLILAFVWYESHYEVSDITVDGKEGIANFMGNYSNGEINNGSSESETKDLEESVKGQRSESAD